MKQLIHITHYCKREFYFHVDVEKDIIPLIRLCPDEKTPTEDEVIQQLNNLNNIEEDEDFYGLFWLLEDITTNLLDDDSTFHDSVEDTEFGCIQPWGGRFKEGDKGVPELFLKHRKT